MLRVPQCLANRLTDGGEIVSRTGIQQGTIHKSEGEFCIVDLYYEPGCTSKACFVFKLWEYSELCSKITPQINILSSARFCRLVCFSVAFDGVMVTIHKHIITFGAGSSVLRQNALVIANSASVSKDSRPHRVRRSNFTGAYIAATQLTHPQCG
jgi:hypothetical protein